MARPKGPTLTQKDIVDAAIAVLQKDGAAALGVNRVARELGIQPPSLYNHVAGNEGLFRLVALAGWQRFLEYAQRDLAQVSARKSTTGKSATSKSATSKSATSKSTTGKSATSKSATGKSATGKSATGKPVTSADMLRAAAYSYRDCARQNPELLAIASNHGMSLDDAEFVAVFEAIVGIYRTALAPLGFNDDQVIHATRMLNAAFFGFAQAEKAGIFVMPQSLDESYTWMVDRLIEALERMPLSGPS
jgi:AcrR family transcriptional regulator